MTHLALAIGDGTLEPDAVERSVRLAEDAGFALVTFDGTTGPEAGVLASYLALRTSRVGLGPTLHVTTTEPFHLATQLASLDHATLGRAAWVIGAHHDAAALATVGRAPLTADALRAETRDVVDVARALWDSWEDDASILDAATGRFLDADRVHHVNFTGDTFSIVGPLITPRPPQGQVVVLGADTLGVTGRLDVALVGTDTEARAAAARDAGAPLVFAEVAVGAGDPAADRLHYPGPPGGLAEYLAAIPGVDGVRLHLTDLADLPRIAEHLGRPPAPGTLRERLGLPRPANRFAREATR